MAYPCFILGHGLKGRNGMDVRRLGPDQLNAAFRRLQGNSERVEEGLRIFEINSQEDCLFASEAELLSHIVEVLRLADKGLNRLARKIHYKI